MIAYGALGLAALALVVVVVGGSGGGGGYIVRAEFRDAGGLRGASSVKIAGVTGGTVSSIVATPRDTAIATFKLDSNAAPIGAGASVEVRPTDLLGERYAQLNVGDLSKPQRSGTLIPIDRTSAPVELDDILNTFNADTRTRLRILINEAGVAMAGRGADFNKLLGALPPDIDQARILLGQVASQNATLKNLIAQGDRITTAVNGKRDQLGNLINVASGALGAVADRQAQLAATMTGAPGALTQLRRALDQVGSAADAITPAASSLQNAAAPLTATLRALPSFTDSAHATLMTARKAAPDLKRLGVEARSPLRALRPTALKLQSLTRDAQPILSELDQRAMRDLLWFVENWALALKGRDGLGHFVGANLSLDSSIIQSALDFFVNNGGLLPSRDRGARTRSGAAAAHGGGAVGANAAPAPGATNAPPSGSNGLPQGLKDAIAPALAGVSSLANTTAANLKRGVGTLTGAQNPQGGAPPPPSSSPASNARRLLDYLFGP
jgi:phospholipid/cholesterol/gamma-HCH transport system substrate-binding protein